MACVGTACATVLLACVPLFEGTVHTTYVDPVGVVTACTGHTGPELKLGQTFTKQQCDDMLMADLVKHAEPVLKCAPVLKDHIGPLAASVSLAYNIGTNAFCASTIVKLFRAGDWAGGCAEFSKWVKAKGKVLPGLIKRRAYERAMCEGKLGGSTI